jgi:hypothetical protein
MIDGSGYRSISMTNGSGRPKNIRIPYDGFGSATLLFRQSKTTEMPINGMEGTNYTG